MAIVELLISHRESERYSFQRMTGRTTRRKTFQKVARARGGAVEKDGKGDGRTATMDGGGMANLSYLLFARTSRIRVYKSGLAATVLIYYLSRRDVRVHTEIARTCMRGHRANERVCVNTYTLCVYTKQAATSNSKASFKAPSLFLLSRL